MPTQATKAELLAFIDEQNQALIAARNEASQLRLQFALAIQEGRDALARVTARYEWQIKALSTKLFAAHSERSKWQARAHVTSLAEHMVAARDEAMRTGHSVAVRGC